MMITEIHGVHVKNDEFHERIYPNCSPWNEGFVKKVQKEGPHFRDYEAYHNPLTRPCGGIGGLPIDSRDLILYQWNCPS